MSEKIENFHEWIETKLSFPSNKHLIKDTNVGINTVVDLVISRMTHSEIISIHKSLNEDKINSALRFVYVLIKLLGIKYEDFKQLHYQLCYKQVTPYQDLFGIIFDNRSPQHILNKLDLKYDNFIHLTTSMAEINEDLHISDILSLYEIGCQPEPNYSDPNH